MLLLLQQRDELPLGGDVPPDALVGVVQVADNGGTVRGGVGRLQVPKDNWRLVYCFDIPDGDALPHQGSLRLTPHGSPVALHAGTVWFQVGS